MDNTWTQTKSPRMFRLRRGEYTAIVHFLVDGTTSYRVYRKGLQGVRQQGFVAPVTDTYGFSIAEKGLALAIAEDTAPSTRRPALLTFVPFGRYKYVAYYLRRKGYADVRLPRRQGDDPLVLGEAGTAVVDEVTKHLMAIAPGVVVV